jgi:hypothetical protein
MKPNDNDTIKTFQIPTFRNGEDGDAEELDITTLNESSVATLRRENPFMYFSIFDPLGNLRAPVYNAVANLLSMMQGRVDGNQDEKEDGNHQGREGSSDHTPSVMVRRRTAVSTEVDSVTAGIAMFENIGNNDPNPPEGDNDPNLREGSDDPILPEHSSEDSKEDEENDQDE